MLNRRAPLQRAQGFSLIEMMVALVVGLIVTAAVLALVVAIMKSNRQTLDSTRLNQEMRATLAVISSELRRARSVDDPLTIAKRVGGNPYGSVDTATAGCIRFAYAGGVGGDCRVLRRATNAIELLTAAPNAAGNCTTTCAAGGGIALGSNQVRITALTFTPTTTALTAATTRRYDVTITGNLVSPDPELSGISRTMTETIFVRSVGAGN